MVPNTNKCIIIGITGKEVDSFYIPMRKLLWRPLKPVGEKASLS